MSGKAIQLSKELPGLIDQAIILGYGSVNGSRIEVIGGMNDDNAEFDYTVISKEYVTYFGDDPNVTVDSNHNVISKINEANLQQIANTLHGDYYHREDDNMPNAVISALTAAASIQHDSSDTTTNTRAETYWVFAILLLVLLAWEGEDILIRILAERNKKNA